MTKKVGYVVFFIVLFIFVNVVVYNILEINKQNKIDISLNSHLSKLEIQYKTLMYHWRVTANAAYKSTSSINKVIDILSKAQTSSIEEKAILRKQLYTIMKNKYNALKTKGVYQFGFALPDKTVFLRIHRPKKFGDDVSKHYRIEYVNKFKKSLHGYEKGKITPAFRNAYPLFDKNNNYIGSMEISFSSDTIQKYFSNVSKIDTHFLIHKDVFNTKIWKKYNMDERYIKSKEHSAYMVSLMDNNKNNISNNIKLSSIKECIYKKIEKGEKFRLHNIYNNKTTVLSFFPIRNIKDKKNVAWIVSYENNDFIDLTIKSNTNIFIIIFFILLVLFYFIYRNLNQKMELEQKNKNFEYLLDSTMEAIVLSDKNNKIIQCNQISVDLFKEKNKSSFLGRNITDFVPDYEISELQKSLQLVYSKPRNCNLLKKDGTEFPVLASGRDIVINGEKVRVSIILDLTQIKQQELQLIKSEKMAAMGEMIGNIAHQWRQPLSVISTASTGIIMQKEYGILDEDKLIKTCNAINDNAQYLSKTIDDFKNFIKGERTKTIFNLKNDIGSFLNLVEGSIKTHNINIILDLQEDIKIDGYKNELIQCLINIFNNAKDVLVEKKIKDKFIFISTYIKDNKTIIKIKDNADGIPKDILPKIFEPYFTTKHKSKGTGLGLHMTYNLIVDGMGGTVEAINQTYDYKGKQYSGAEFVITLPI
ncbi:MAG: PAS domain-containing protein [Arcobacteraceae bacterium]|nr:PAS domain-containing protein [Arcobacteraceae bacterium]